MSKSKKENKNSKQASLNEAGVEVGEQMPLMDVSPEHSKEIVKVARAYKAKVNARLAIQKGKNGEEDLQQELLNLVKAENLSRDNEGKIKFTVAGIEIELVPTKEKVKVKMVDE